MSVSCNDCNRDDEPNIPPSASSSPATPMMTHAFAVLYSQRLFQRSDSGHSPTKPTIRTRENTISATSDACNQSDAAVLDRESKKIISGAAFQRRARLAVFQGALKLGQRAGNVLYALA